MMMKTIALGGVALFALATAASAEDMLVLGAADLDRVTAAGEFDYLANLDVDVAEDVLINVNVNKVVTSSFTATGNQAFADAFADAIDNSETPGATLTETLTTAQAGPGLSQSSSSSFAGFTLVPAISD